MSNLLLCCMSYKDSTKFHHWAVILLSVLTDSTSYDKLGDFHEATEW